MKKILFILYIIIATSVFAHEHWIYFNDFYPKQKELIDFFLCSGHNYPESDNIISERVIHNTDIKTPSNTIISYSTEENNNCRISEFSFNDEGIYIISFELSRTQEPEYCVKSIIITAEYNEIYSENSYTSGNLIEIIPLTPLSHLNANDEIYLKIIYNNKPVISNLCILPEGERAFYLYSNDEGIFSFSVKEKKYLITSSYNGKGCSLTFEIRD